MDDYADLLDWLDLDAADSQSSDRPKRAAAAIRALLTKQHRSNLDYSVLEVQNKEILRKDRIKTREYNILVRENKSLREKVDRISGLGRFYVVQCAEQDRERVLDEWLRAHEFLFLVLDPTVQP